MKKNTKTVQTLDAIMLATGTDKSTNGHGYSKIYDELFEPWREKPITFLELGVWEGASLRAWAQYFTHADARIFGADNDLGRMQPVDDERITAIPAQLDQLPALHILAAAIATPIDLIVDDSAHNVVQQMASFDVLWPRVMPGGLYVIEDLHTYFWPRSNPVGSSGWLHHRIDRVLGLGAEPRDNDSEIARMLTYPSMIVFQKRGYDWHALPA